MEYCISRILQAAKLCRSYAPGEGQTGSMEKSSIDDGKSWFAAAW